MTPDIPTQLAAMLDRAARMKSRANSGDCDSDDVAEICTDLPRVVRALQRVWEECGKPEFDNVLSLRAIITEELAK